MGLELYQEVMLIVDIPDVGLRAGDVTTLVEHVAHPSGGDAGVILEVFNALGDSIAVVTVPASTIAPRRADQVPAVRSLAHAA